MEELWEIKDDIAKECDHDIRRLFDRLKEIQQSSNKPTVNRTNLKPSRASSE